MLPLLLKKIMLDISYKVRASANGSIITPVWGNCSMGTGVGALLA